SNDNKKEFEKIIIIVDNIDRCSKETAFHILSDLKTFLTCSSNVMFIVPVDDESLKLHIRNTGNNDYYAGEFLRKIFNLSFRIKPIRRSDLYMYLKRVNQEGQLNLANTTLDIISKGLAANPRTVKQFINSLLAELAICAQRETEEFAKEH